MEKDKLIYLAGIVDGEGTIRLHKANHTYFRLSLRVANNDLHLMEFLKENFGGGFWIVHKAGAQGNNKQSYCWEITGKKLYEILNGLKDYCIVKKEQVALGIRYSEALWKRDRLGLDEEVIENRDKMVKVFSMLNRRGNEKGGVLYATY